MTTQDRLDRLERLVGQLMAQIHGTLPVRLADHGGTTTLRIAAGTTNAVVLSTATTFELESIAVIAGTPPASPLTVLNTFAESYALGQAVVVFEQADGTWTNIPFFGRVYAGVGDVFAETLWYKLWNHGTYNSETHQPVYFEEIAATLETHGPPIPRGLVRAFTNKPEDAAEYDEGYCIEIEDSTTDLIHLDQITAAAGTQAVDFVSSDFQFWFHDQGATAREDAKWNSVSGYDDAANQMWWHQSHNFAFKTTDDYDDTDATQLLGHVNGTWKWKSIAAWLNLLPGYDSAKDQTIGHTNGGATEWKDLVNITLNNPTSVELNLSTSLESKLNYTPYTTARIWAAAGSAASFTDTVSVDDCE